MKAHGGQLQEVPGSYGNVLVGEREVQRLWARRASRMGKMVSREGQTVQVLHPGRWNFQEGPDFIDAIVEIGGERCHGDVEIHFRAGDWMSHRHGHNANFQRVILHVIMFPADGWPVTLENAHTVEWLKYLEVDLETAIEDELLAILSEVDLPPVLGELLGLPLSSRVEALQKAARRRWQRKLAQAGARLQRHGWAESCHQTMLETLGLARNRAVMASLALANPLSAWNVAGMDAESLFAQGQGRWKLAGVRPANQPRRRLKNYSDWVERCGTGWPDSIPAPVEVADRLRDCPGLVAGGRIKKSRQIARTAEWQKAIRHYFEPAVGGCRVDTLVADGLLPLWAAAHGQDLADLWFLWYPGDISAQVERAVCRLDLPAVTGYAAANGWFQGILGLLESEQI